MIYLASPYTCKCEDHKDDLSLRRHCGRIRFFAARDFCARLMRLGAHVISPIAHSHPIAMANDLPTDFDFWQSLDHDLIDRCDVVMVLELPGHEQSAGVADEIAYARSIGKLVVCVRPEVTDDELRTLDCVRLQGDDAADPCACPLPRCKHGHEPQLYSENGLRFVGCGGRKRGECLDTKGHAKWPDAIAEWKSLCEGAPSTEGRKDDTGKLRFDLIPAGALSSLASIYVHDKDDTEHDLFAAIMHQAWMWWGRQPLPDLRVVACNALELLQREVAPDEEIEDHAAQEGSGFDFMPARAMQELARVYTIGAAKYADRNWERGIAWSRVFAALQRHAWAWRAGEQCDPVDGQYHLASVAWCALALIEYERTHPELDDRPGK